MNLQRYGKSLKKTWRRLQKHWLGGRSILVLGDSHCGVFEYCFDLSRQTLDPERALVDERYVARAEDHHLSHPASAPLWSASLLKSL